MQAALEHEEDTPMTEKSTRNATLTLGNQSIEFPVYDAVHGPSVCSDAPASSR